jgi:L-fucose isomerase-like protein
MLQREFSQLLKVLPVLVCRKEQLQNNFMKEKVQQLKRNLKLDTQILDYVVITDEKDVRLIDDLATKAQVILLYKPHLGLGDCIVKISRCNIPVILFNDEGIVNNPLDALEYVYPKENVWVAVDYQDISSYFAVLSARERMRQTKILVLNADYPHWEKLLCRVHGGREAIRDKLGIELEYVKSEDVLARWENMAEERVKPIADRWIKEAEKIVEPNEKDLLAVARLYLVMKDLLKEKNAQAITMAYGQNSLPVPCFAYTNLRDEQTPSACEADIISLVNMVMLHYITRKPCLMGNTFFNADDETLIINHCVCPRRMEGYDATPAPYKLRRYHEEKFKGSLTAFVKMKTNQEVTICRLSGDLKTMLIAYGTIVDCVEKEGDMCRVEARVKIKNPRDFIHRTSGNHHVLVYGDHREQLRKLDETLGITTTEV